MKLSGICVRASMNHKIKGIYIDKRDLQLFHYLFSVKAATYQQIHRDICQAISLDRTGQRLRSLEDNRFVEISLSRLVLGGKRIVNLRKKAFEKMICNGDEKRKEFKSDSLLHDIALGDIRYNFLKSSKIVDYQTENEIQTWGGEERRLNSDGIATIALPKRNIKAPIEFERTQKGKSRYSPMINKYYSASEFPIIFFISEEPHTIELVQNIEKELFKEESFKIFYALHQDILTNETLKLKNGNGTVISL